MFIDTTTFIDTTMFIDITTFIESTDTAYMPYRTDFTQFNVNNPGRA